MILDSNSENIAHACRKIDLFGERILEISTTCPTPAPCADSQKTRLPLLVMANQNMLRTHAGK